MSLPPPTDLRPVLANGTAAPPTSAAGAPLPAATAPPPPVVNAPPSGLALLRALRRRWLVALLTAPTAALLVAAAIWLFLPPGKQTARAVLELNPVTPTPVLRPTGPEVSLDNFRQLQIALIKNQRVIAGALRDPKVAQVQTLREVDDPLPWLEQSLSFSAPGGAQVLEVKLQGEHADDLRLLLNAVIKSYLAEFINSELTVRNGRLDALRKLETDLDAELRRDQATRNQFKNQGAGNTSIVAWQMASLQAEMARLKTRISDLEGEVAQKETEARLLERRDPGRLPLDNATFQEFFKQDFTLQSLEEERKVASASVVDAQVQGFVPAVVNRLKEKVARLEQQIRERQQELRPQAESYYRQHAASELLREGALVNETLELKRSLVERHRKDLDRYQKMFEDLSRNQVKLDDSLFNSEATAEMLQQVRREKRRLESEVNAAPRVRELEEARVLPLDVKDRKIRLMALGGGLTFVLMLAGLAMWEFHSRRVESVDQIVYGLGLPLVGTVPAMPRRHLVGLPAGGSDSEVEQWRLALHESVATARTVLLNAARSTDMRLIMITSAMSGEGKTSLSTQLAVSLALAGRRTLLLDFDMRNPSAHRMVGMPHAPGWAEILRGELNVADAVKPTTLDKLFFIPAGDCDPIALKSLVQEELGQVLHWLRSQYDFVVVDTCPVLPVVDALLLGRHMDAVIFSVLSEVSQLPKVYIATQRLAQLGIRTLGAVVNGVREDKYGYGAYGYGPRKPAARPSANGTGAAPAPKSAVLSPTPPEEGPSVK